MLTSLAFIFLVGLSLAAICQALKLPRIIGMLITGILLGPYVLNVLDPSKSWLTFCWHRIFWELPDWKRL